jgi:DNA-binding response OmpR family regulator
LRAQQLARALPASALVAFAQSAGAAQQAISLRRPDLVVTELDLPDLLGVDFITRLQNTPATHHVLVMVVTARRAVHDKIAALRAGADDYIVAPVAPDNFALHVQLLSRFRPHRGL